LLNIFILQVRILPGLKLVEMNGDVCPMRLKLVEMNGDVCPVLIVIGLLKKIASSLIKITLFGVTQSINGMIPICKYFVSMCDV